MWGGVYMYICTYSLVKANKRPELCSMNIYVLRWYSWTHLGQKSLRLLLYAIHSHLHQLILLPP
jgi:hypothetical protein